MRPTPAHPEQTLTLRLKVISCELLAVLWTNPQSVRHSALSLLRSLSCAIYKYLFLSLSHHEPMEKSAQE